MILTNSDNNGQSNYSIPEKMGKGVPIYSRRKVAGAIAVSGALLAGVLVHLLRKTFD